MSNFASISYRKSDRCLIRLNLWCLGCTVCSQVSGELFYFTEIIERFCIFLSRCIDWIIMFQHFLLFGGWGVREIYSYLFLKNVPFSLFCRLLVWEEFMFACSLYPTNQMFLLSVQEEVRYQVTPFLAPSPRRSSKPK